MHPPLVSVLVPAWNAARHIEGAIASALAQTMADLEVVVVDDASTDGTAAVVERLARGDARVRLVRAARNGGPARARNRAIEASRGQWLALLDSDDGFAPSRLERLLALAAATGADLIADNLRYLDGASGRCLDTMLPEGAEAPPEVLTAEAFVLRNMAGRRGADLGYLKPLIRRDLLARTGIRYREDVRIGEDFHLYLDCLLAGARFVLVREALYDYRLHAGSLSHRLTVTDLVTLAVHNLSLIAALDGSAPSLLTALRQRQAQIQGLLGAARSIELLKAGRLLSAAVRLAVAPRAWPVILRYGREAVLKRLGVLGRHGLPAA